MSSTTYFAPPNSSEAAIFGRLLSNGGNAMRADLARYVLTLGFDETDQARMADLAARNQKGELTPQERDELLNFVKTGHLLALMQSRARKALRKKGA